MAKLVIVLMLMAMFMFCPNMVMDMFAYIFSILCWIVLGCVAIALLIYLYLKVTGKKASSLGITVRSEKGFEEGFWVGSKGVNLPLNIIQQPSGTRVEWATRNYVIVIAALTAFGPGILLLYVFDRAGFPHNMPLALATLFGLFWLLICGLLAQTLYVFFCERKAVLFAASSIKLLKGVKQSEEWWVHDLKTCRIKTVSYTDEGSTVTNYVLVAEKNDGTQRGLCITDKEQQLRFLLQLLLQKGYPVSEPE